MAKHATIDTSNPSCIIITYPEKELSNAELDGHQGEMLELYNKYKDFIIIHDARKTKYLSSELRIKEGNWFKKHDALIREKCLGSVYVITSTMVYIILKGMFLIHKPTVPYTIVSSMAEAKKWADQQLKSVSV